KGRNALMSASRGGEPVELTPPDANVRSRVHEYGGRPYAVVDGAIVYADFMDQRLRRIGSPIPLTADGMRYADGAGRHRDVYIVREDHSTAGERGGEPVNAIVAIDLDRPLSDRVLYDQSDFVAYPRSAPTAR